MELAAIGGMHQSFNTGRMDKWERDIAIISASIAIGLSVELVRRIIEIHKSQG